MKKKYLLIPVLLIPVTLLAAFFLRTPPMPSSWHQLTIGMPRNQALATLPTLSTDMYELKGFDVAHDTTHLLGERYTWTLTVFYDEQMRVKNISAHSANTLCGYLDHSPTQLGI